MSEGDEIGQWKPSGDGHFVGAGAWCPSCREDGGMFHYGPDEHQCENCLKMLDDKTYFKLLMKNPAPRNARIA